MDTFSDRTITKFWRNIKSRKNNIKEYIKSLVVFTNSILYNNKLEKVMFKLNKIIFRQLLYKQHRINYLLY